MSQLVCFLQFIYNYKLYRLHVRSKSNFKINLNFRTNNLNFRTKNLNFECKFKFCIPILISALISDTGGPPSWKLWCSCIAFWHVRCCSHQTATKDVLGILHCGGASYVQAAMKTQQPQRPGKKTTRSRALQHQTTPTKGASNAAVGKRSGPAPSNSNTPRSRRKISTRSPATEARCWDCKMKRKGTQFCRLEKKHTAPPHTAGPCARPSRSPPHREPPVAASSPLFVPPAAENSPVSNPAVFQPPSLVPPVRELNREAPARAPPAQWQDHDWIPMGNEPPFCLLGESSAEDELPNFSLSLCSTDDYNFDDLHAGLGDEDLAADLLRDEDLDADLASLI